MDKARRYNNGKLRWSLVHYKSLEPLVRVLMYGAEKYTVKDEQGNITSSGDHNWKNGLPPAEILESLQRHLAALMDGETHDAESGLPHIGHILCNSMFYSFYTRDKDTTLK